MKTYFIRLISNEQKFFEMKAENLDNLRKNMISKFKKDLNNKGTVFVYTNADHYTKGKKLGKIFMFEDEGTVWIANGYTYSLDSNGKLGSKLWRS